MSLKDLLFAKAAGGGGGGNPNRVEVIQGTLDNPFTGWTKAEYGEFLDAYYDGNASATMSVDATVIGYAEADLVLEPFYVEPSFSFCTIGNDGAIALTVSYFGNFEEIPLLATASGYTTADGVIDFREYASLIPTTLTIIWHPLPDQS